MRILDALRGRPSVDRVAAIVDAADAVVETDALGAQAALAGLGGRPWFRELDHSRVEYGFALRAYAAGVVGDEAAAFGDLTELAHSSSAPGSLLPLVPLLAERPGDRFDAAASLLVDRFGACGRADCGHGPALDAAIGLIGHAIELDAVVRWVRLVASDGEVEALQIAAFLRARALGANGRASDLLEGPGQRLLLARAQLAYNEQRYGDVLELLPPTEALAIRASLVLLLDGKSVPIQNRQVLAAESRHSSELQALLAEADGQFLDAAVTWRTAGHQGRALEATILAERGSTPHSSLELSLDPGVMWFAYASGTSARPSGQPTSETDRQNAAIALDRTRLGHFRAGRGLHLGDLKPPIGLLRELLVMVRDDPARIPLLLQAGTPGDSVGALLSRVKDIPSEGRARVSAAWKAWNEANAQATPLPRPTHALRWLALRDGYAVPTRADLAGLEPQARMPVLAALVASGFDWALADAVQMLQPDDLRAMLPQALPDLPGLALAVASRTDAETRSRRQAALVAAVALANAVVRGGSGDDAADAATRRVAAAVADLVPDPDELTCEEAYRIERDALAAFPTRGRRRANGPVLCWLADLDAPEELPEAVFGLYYSDPPAAALLLRAGRPEAARRALAGDEADTLLVANIAAAHAGRLLASKRPYDALHELAAVPDPTDLVLVDGDLIDMVASAVVKDRSDIPVDDALVDADVLLGQLGLRNSVKTMMVELLLQRTRARPGSAALDVLDLERAYEIDPSHPVVPRALALSLTVRGMEVAETRPAQAVSDVDRATDIYMGDAEIVEVASRVALHAASVLWSKQRNRTAADHALGVALSIDSNNSEALRARMMLRGQL